MKRTGKNSHPQQLSKIVDKNQTEQIANILSVKVKKTIKGEKSHMLQK